MIRKRTYTLFLHILLVLFFYSCANELDSIRPKNQISQDQLSDDDLGKVVNGVYAAMEEFVFQFYRDGDIKGENFIGGPGFALNDPMLMTPSSSNVLSLWRKSYTTLKQVNFLVETYENSENKDLSVFKTAGGTGYFFRALIYYNLAIRWGGVPILKERTNEVVPISPENDVWDFILDDLKKAETLLPDYSDKFYVSQPANDALLARVHLSLENNQKAYDYSDKVISRSNFELSNTSKEYASMFVQNSNSKETIFALANTRSSSLLLLYQDVNDTDATWAYAPSEDSYNLLYESTSMKQNDIRSEAVFSPNDKQRTLKFPNGQEGQFISNDNASQSPIVVFRLAEMYLIRIEALKNTTKGKQALESFLNHRYQSVSLSEALSDLEFQNLILDERHREFYGEGFRWYDLKRTNRLDLFESLNNRDYLMYFPIPQNERDLAGHDNYPQNSGY